MIIDIVRPTKWTHREENIPTAADKSDRVSGKSKQKNGYQWLANDQLQNNNTTSVYYKAGGRYIQYERYLHPTMQAIESR